MKIVLGVGPKRGEIRGIFYVGGGSCVSRAVVLCWDEMNHSVFVCYWKMCAAEEDTRAEDFLSSAFLRPVSPPRRHEKNPSVLHDDMKSVFSCRRGLHVVVED